MMYDDNVEANKSLGHNKCVLIDGVNHVVNKKTRITESRSCSKKLPLSIFKSESEMVEAYAIIDDQCN